VGQEVLRKINRPRRFEWAPLSFALWVTLLVLRDRNFVNGVVMQDDLLGEVISIAGGRIRCLQCSAQSKRTKLRCRSPAIRGKKVCRIHGGLSTGPRTPEGKARSVAAKTVHGRDTRAIRHQASLVAQHLVEVEALGRTLGMFTGPRLRGRKPG